MHGIDIINNTTILDIKPYLPFDVVDRDMLKVPKWVDNNDIFKPLNVTIDNNGKKNVLDKLINYVKYDKSIWWKADESNEFINTIKEVLRWDIRSKHQGRGDVNNNKEKTNKMQLTKQIGDGNDTLPRVYTLNLDQKSTQIKFITKEDGVHVVDVLYD